MIKRIIGTSSVKNGSLFKDRFFVCFFSLFCAGLIVGAISSGICYSDTDSAIYKIWQENFLRVSSENLLSVFLQNLLSSLTYFAIIYSLGVCAVGLPFLFAVPFVLGVGKGILLGFLLPQKNLTEVVRNIVFFVPQNIVFCITALIAINLSSKMSIQTFSGMAQIKYEQFQYISFKKYNQRFVIFAILFIFYCLLDAVLMRFY